MQNVDRLTAQGAPAGQLSQSGPVPRRSSGRPEGVALAAFYVAYLLAMAFGRWMTVIPDIPITLWPPNGVVLAMLLTQPRQSWPWWIGLAALGELTGNALWFHNPLVWAVGYVGANAAAVVLAVLALGAMLRLPIHRFDNLRQVLAFLALGVLAAPAVSATLGSAIDAFIDRNPFTTTWPVWWLGDATGILIATPLVVSLVNAWQEKAWPRPAQLAEAAAIALLLSLLSLWILFAGAGYAFLLPLPILWAALRFEFRGVSFAVLVLTLAIALHAQTFHDLALSGTEIAALHNKLKALILVAASTGLIVAAITRQQRQALADLARTNDELEARVAERTSAIAAAERRFQATFENAGVGIGILGADGTLLQVNDSLARTLGREVSEMEGHGIDEFTHPEDRALMRAAWARLATGEEDGYDLEKRYLHKDGDTIWGHTTVSGVRDADGRLAYLIKVIQDITERKRSEALRQLLMREVSHRSKNLLTVVQVIARQTARHSPHQFIETLNERLRALAANQDLLVHNDWQRVALTDLVRSQLTHFEAVAHRIQLSGPPIMVPPDAAQALGMALHELATNAAKHGSLSTETGRVEICWAVEEDRFRISWQERGGPPVTPPDRTGFGTTVLQHLTASSMSGEVSLSYGESGLGWELRCPLSKLEETGDSETVP